MERSFEETMETLNVAKLAKSELIGYTQSLFYADDFPRELKLMELTKDMLETLKTTGTVTFRGQLADTVVLCTDSKTYEVKETETTNSMLLLPTCFTGELNAVQPSATQNNVCCQQVCGIYNSYLELRPIRGRVRQIRGLLLQCTFFGPENEFIQTGTKYSLETLLDIVQASEQEIMTYIGGLLVINYEGYYRLLDFDYVSKVLSLVVNFITENSWSWQSFSVEETLQTLEELEPRTVLQRCLNWFTIPNIDETTCSLVEEKVSRHFAEVILKHTGKFHYDEFMTTWQASLPQGMNISLEHVKGLMLVNKTSVPKTVQYFTSEALPESAQERFDCLFSTKPSWLLEEISPYLEDLASATLDVAALLAKFSRCSVVDGIKCYSTRKPL